MKKENKPILETLVKLRLLIDESRIINEKFKNKAKFKPKRTNNKPHESDV